jgi:hypothetical protein
MLKFVSNIIFLSLFFIIKIEAQNDLLRQKNLADSLFSNKNYFDAITEYKRLLFFDSQELFNYYALNQIALCYKFGGWFELSTNYFSLALIKAKTNSEIFECKIHLCRLNIIQNRTKNAHRILDELESDEQFSAHSNEIKYWRGWIYFYEMDWKTAYQIFKELNIDYLSQLCLLNQETFYSVQKAKILSSILPGLGQFYLGNYLNGFGSLIWNVISGYFTIKAFLDERIFDGVVLSNLLRLRFYRGNIDNVEKQALEKNKELFLQSLFEVQKIFREGIP